MAPFICGPLCAIYNASVREGFVPPIWKHADTMPAPKVNPPKSLQSDLRPISLTLTLSKLLESFVSKWTLNVIKTTIDRRQIGVLKGRSTTRTLVVSKSVALVGNCIEQWWIHSIHTFCRHANKLINSSRSDHIRQQLSAASDCKTRWKIAKELLHSNSTRK